jgi:hypothetical protein
MREQKPLSRRAKWLLGLSGAVTVVAIVVLILATSSSATKPGCVQTTLPGVIGAQSFDECGQEARQTCAHVKGDTRQFGTVGVLIVEKACRKGQLSVG